MAIERVTVPTPTAPLTTTDYQAILAQLLASSQAFTGREIVDGSTIHAGTVMLIGGVLYKATSDTTVSGTASLYVKITPSGATATAAFITDLTSVAWNHAYGGYYDGSGSGSNLVVFDEARAIVSGLLTKAYTMQGQIAYISGALIVKGGVGIGGVLSVTGASELTGGVHSGGDVDADGNIYGASVTSDGSVEGASLAISGATDFKNTSVTVSSSGYLDPMELLERRTVSISSGANKYVYAPASAGTMYLAYIDGGTAAVYRDGNQLAYNNGTTLYVVRVR